MRPRPIYGEMALQEKIPEDVYDTYTVDVARTFDDFLMAASIRAAVFMQEQDCPFEEEFDGNDLCGTHLILKERGQPVGTIRLRWFVDCVKVERTSLLPHMRGNPALRLLLAEAFEMGARKGFPMALAQIQARLWSTWQRHLKCRLRTDRAPFFFSDYEYREIEIPLPKHPDAVTSLSDPMRIIRPEGAWDEPGVLDESAVRSKEVSQPIGKAG